jgi:hypothetical protein
MISPLGLPPWLRHSPGYKKSYKRDITPAYIYSASEGAGVADARTSKRFPVELPIQMHGTGLPEDQTGTTANVSAGGVYIRAELPEEQQCPEYAELQKDSAVEFDITLPADAIGAEQDTHVRCHGRVMRVEEIKGEKSGHGVACVIDNYEFVRGR